MLEKGTECQIYASANWVVRGSDNGLSPDRHQASLPERTSTTQETFTNRHKKKINNSEMIDIAVLLVVIREAKGSSDWKTPGTCYVDLAGVVPCARVIFWA